MRSYCRQVRICLPDAGAERFVVGSPDLVDLYLGGVSNVTEEAFGTAERHMVVPSDIVAARIQSCSGLIDEKCAFWHGVV